MTGVVRIGEAAAGVAEFTEELIGICRLVGAFERDAVCGGDVTFQQCVALQDLLDGPRTVQELAALAGVTSSATTRLVDGLERRGWVARTRDGGDRRKVYVALTGAGQQEASRLRGLTADSAAAILAGVAPERREPVIDALREVRAAVERARADGGITCC